MMLLVKKPETLNHYHFFFSQAFYSHRLEGVNKELRPVQPTEMPKELFN